MRIDTVSAIHTSRPRVSLTRAAASQPDERSLVIRREACSQGRQTAELQSDVANLHSQLNMARHEAAISARQGAEMHQARHSVSLESLGCSRASVAPSQDDIVVLPRAVRFCSYTCVCWNGTWALEKLLPVESAILRHHWLPNAPNQGLSYGIFAVSCLSAAFATSKYRITSSL